MELLFSDLNFEIIFTEDDLSIELTETPIELVFEEPIEVERSIDRFLSKKENIDRFILPLIPKVKDGEDGKTPIKGVDYKDGVDGVTPKKGVDYFTKKELTTIQKALKEVILSELPKIVTEDEINVKLEDVFKKIPKESRIEKGATFLRQLLDVKMNDLSDLQYGFTYNKAKAEFTLTQISSSGGTWGSITGTLSNQTDLQTALDAKVNKAGDTMTGDLNVPDEAYGSAWNGSMEVPTKNALYDKIESIPSTPPGGSATNLQYNASGVFGGLSDSSVDSANGYIGINNSTPLGSVHAGSRTFSVGDVSTPTYTIGGSTSGFSPGTQQSYDIYAQRVVNGTTIYSSSTNNVTTSTIFLIDFDPSTLSLSDYDNGPSSGYDPTSDSPPSYQIFAIYGGGSISSINNASNTLGFWGSSTPYRGVSLTWLAPTIQPEYYYIFRNFSDYQVISGFSPIFNDDNSGWNSGSASYSTIAGYTVTLNWTAVTDATDYAINNTIDGSTIASTGNVTTILDDNTWGGGSTTNSPTSAQGTSLVSDGDTHLVENGSTGRFSVHNGTGSTQQSAIDVATGLENIGIYGGSTNYYDLARAGGVLPTIHGGTGTSAIQSNSIPYYNSGAPSYDNSGAYKSNGGIAINLSSGGLGQLHIHRPATSTSDLWLTNNTTGSAGTAGVLISLTTAGGLDIKTVGSQAMTFYTNNTARWNYSSSGHFLANTDNTLDIGASGATRPRTGYFGTSVVSPFFRATDAAGTSRFDGIITKYALDGTSLSLTVNSITGTSWGAGDGGYFGRMILNNTSDSGNNLGGMLGFAYQGTMRSYITTTVSSGPHTSMQFWVSNAGVLVNPFTVPHDGNIVLGKANGTTHGSFAIYNSAGYGQVNDGIILGNMQTGANSNMNIRWVDYANNTIAKFMDVYPGGTKSGNIAVFTGDGTNLNEVARWTSAGEYVIGATTASAKLHVISTSNLFRAGYDASNYFKADVSSTGATTFDAVGSGASFIFSDDVKLGTAGNGLYIKEGSNATMGVATLVAGVVVVSTTKVTANSRIFLTRQTTAGTLGTSVDVTARTAGTSFTITSNGSILDTSTVAWVIVEPA